MVKIFHFREYFSSGNISLVKCSSSENISWSDRARSRTVPVTEREPGRKLPFTFQLMVRVRLRLRQGRHEGTQSVGQQLPTNKQPVLLLDSANFSSTSHQLYHFREERRIDSSTVVLLLHDTM